MGAVIPSSIKPYSAFDSECSSLTELNANPDPPGSAKLLINTTFLSFSVDSESISSGDGKALEVFFRLVPNFKDFLADLTLILGEDEVEPKSKVEGVNIGNEGNEGNEGNKENEELRGGEGVLRSIRFCSQGDKTGLLSATNLETFSVLFVITSAACSITESLLGAIIL